MISTVSIYKESLSLIEKRLKDLNKKSIKLGLGEVTYIVSKPYIKPIDKDVKRVYSEWVDVTINGSESIKYKGWKFIATLCPFKLKDESIKNIIKFIPGYKDVSLISKYENKIGLCEHCNQDRQRKYSYLIKHEDGTIKMVGSSCIKDFLGHPNPHAIINYLEAYFIFLEKISNSEYWNNQINYKRYYDIKEILRISKIIKDMYGWISKRRADEEQLVSTASQVFNFFNSPSIIIESNFIQIRDSLNSRKNELDSYLENLTKWINSFDKEELHQNDYLHTIHTIFNTTYISQREFGYAVSIVNSYDVYLEKQNEVESSYIGKIGDKIIINVTCVDKIYIDSYYPTFLNKFKDNLGNDIIWFGMSSKFKLMPNNKYTIKATIKDHNEYCERKQTVLTRVKLIE